LRPLNRFILFFIFFSGVLVAASLPRSKQIVLENSLKVVAVPMHNDSGVISVDIFYNVGSRNETMGKSGLAHMLEHMSFKSTKNLKAGEFDRIVKSFGGISNASTGFDYTHYFIKTATPNLDSSLELLAELMENLSLRDEEFQPERQVVAEERRWRTDNTPTGAMFFTLFNAAYVYHPYHWTPIGFMGDIQSWNIDDLKDFYKRYYQPQNAVLVVSGDFDPKTFFDLAKKRFGRIKNQVNIPAPKVVEPEQSGARRITLIRESEVEMVMIAYKIPRFDSKDVLSLNAAAMMLADGGSSRLNEKLIDKMRLVNSINAFTMELSDPGLFVILAVCNPNVKAERVEREILTEIEAIGEKAAAQKEIDKVKAQAKSEFIYSLENSSTISQFFGEYLVRGNLEPLLNYEMEVEALDAEKIKNVAGKYLTEERSTTVILKKEK
jgi:predicted Zn-dependent peptidase